MSGDREMLALFTAIATCDVDRVTRALAESPDLATRTLPQGATRQDPATYFLDSISHYAYAGDTALHIAAAAWQPDLAHQLVARGAAVRARNRRGAEPLHYAADGRPRSPRRDEPAQAAVIAYLIEVGADPDALDKSGVAPLHRAVRTRTSEAVSALLTNGADPRLMNGSGSTPLHLAVQNTGKSGSGSDAAKDEQRRIIGQLLEHGASSSDVDAKGKSVVDAASGEWIRQLLTP